MSSSIVESNIIKVQRGAGSPMKVAPKYLCRGTTTKKPNKTSAPMNQKGAAVNPRTAPPTVASSQLGETVLHHRMANETKSELIVTAATAAIAAVPIGDGRAEAIQ